MGLAVHLLTSVFDRSVTTRRSGRNLFGVAALPAGYNFATVSIIIRI